MAPVASLGAGSGAAIVAGTGSRRHAPAGPHGECGAGGGSTGGAEPGSPGGYQRSPGGHRGLLGVTGGHRGVPGGAGTVAPVPLPGAGPPGGEVPALPSTPGRCPGVTGALPPALCRLSPPSLSVVPPLPRFPLSPCGARGW